MNGATIQIIELHVVLAQTCMAEELTEADIPGASLGNRKPEALKVVELKFWLRCRGAKGLSKLKTKADCVQQ